MKLAIENGDKTIREDYFPYDSNSCNDNLITEVNDVLKSGSFSMFDNPKVKEFEDKFGKYVNSKNTIAVTNCTSALFASLKALNVGGDDEVILPSYTYVATLMSVLATGAKPVFVDIDKTVNMDVKQLKNKITNKTKAIIPVHMFGNPCNMNEIMKLNIPVVEDCAHATGAKYRGKNVGSFGIGCHSFGEAKVLRIGEGGAVTTNNDEITKQVRILRHEGEIIKRFDENITQVSEITASDWINGVEYPRIGYNFRFSPILAAVAMHKLKELPEFIEGFNRNALQIKNELKNVKELKFQEDTDEGRIYSNIPCTIESNEFTRNTLYASLALEGIPIGVYFPTNLAKIKIINDKGNYPETDKFCNNHLILPNYPNLNKENIKVMCDKVKEVVEYLRKIGKKVEDKAEKILKERKINKFYSTIHVTL